MALEAAYHFDDLGSTTVVDLSGNGRDLDLTGSAGAQVSGGLHDGALGKTGAAMPVLPAAVLAACKSDDRTIMFDALGNLSVWWVRFQDDDISSGNWGILNISGSMAVQARRASDSGLATRPTASPPEAGTWHNYCATYVRSTGIISIYRDGVLANTSSFAAGTELSTGAERIDIAEWSTTGPSIDNLRLYSHALSASEVADIAGTPVAAAPGEITGSGASTAPTGVAAGSGTVTVAGSAASVAPAGVASAVASVTVGGTSTAVAPAAETAGVGTVLVSGFGVSIAPAGVAAGTSLLPAVTPPERTFVVPAESRVLTVAAESRIVEVT